MTQEYMFLLFSANPNREYVKVYPDGEPRMWYVSYKEFKKLIETTAGYNCISSINEALYTYGTFWLFSRLDNSLVRLNFSNGSIESAQKEVSKRMKELTADRTSPINPAENLAKAELNTYIIKDNQTNTGMDISSTNPTIRVR